MTNKTITLSRELVRENIAHLRGMGGTYDEKSSLAAKFEAALLAEQPQGLREQFDTWADENGYDISRNKHGDYVGIVEDSMWTGWQAKAAMAEESDYLQSCEAAHNALADPVPPAGNWAIDTTAGRPILVYQGCSVIEAETAYWLLSLIRQHVAPVPPAGGKPDPIIAVLKGHLADGMNPMFSGGDLKHLIALLETGTRLQAEVSHLRQHKNDYMEAAEETRKALQAEVERLRTVVKEVEEQYVYYFGVAMRVITERNSLQSELTKARDGLLKILHASEWTRDDAHYREVAQTIAEKATANQSAPADKGQVDPVMRCSFCDATDTEGNPWSGGQETYNGDLIYRVWACKDHKHLGDAAVNAAKEQNEPVAWQRRSKEQDANWRWMDAKYVAEARSAGYEVRALYAEQPAPVAVTPFKLISLPPSLTDHPAFDVLRDELKKAGVLVKEPKP